MWFLPPEGAVSACLAAERAAVEATKDAAEAAQVSAEALAKTERRGLPEHEQRALRDKLRRNRR